MNHERLSQSMTAALISLYRGWHFGVDSRTERALVDRGLVTIQRVETAGGKVWNLPYLADGALWIAAELHERELREAGAREAPGGFRVIDGGKR